MADKSGGATRRLILALTAVAVLTAGCTSAGATGGARLSARDRGWQRDVAYLASKLPFLHVDGITHGSRAGWDAAASMLEARVPSLSNGQVLVGLAQLVARLHDDETQPVWQTSHCAHSPQAYRVATTLRPSRLFGQHTLVAQPAGVHDRQLPAQVLDRLLSVIDSRISARQRTGSSVPWQTAPSYCSGSD